MISAMTVVRVHVLRRAHAMKLRSVAAKALVPSIRALCRDVGLRDRDPSMGADPSCTAASGVLTGFTVLPSLAPENAGSALDKLVPKPVSELL